VLSALKRDWALFAFIGAYGLLTCLLAYAIGEPKHIVAFAYLIRWWSLLPLMGCGLVLYVSVRSLRHESPVRGLLDESRALLTAKVAAGLLLFFAVAIYHGLFTSIKTMLPHLAGGFTWDRQLADADALIHGQDPWRYLTFLEPYANIIMPAYTRFWFVLVAFFPLTAILFWRGPVREQFLWSFLLAWALLGNLLAGLFLSGGPIFYHKLHGGDLRFHELVETFIAAKSDLNDVPAALWYAYSRDETTMGAGISAFPSMHLSMATLFFLAAWRMDRRFGLVMLAFLAFVQVASVHLGWHYAIDGYASIALTLGLWKVVGWALNRRTAPQLQAVAA
jgi:hypothetical protein